MGKGSGNALLAAVFSCNLFTATSKTLNLPIILNKQLVFTTCLFFLSTVLYIHATDISHSCSGLSLQCGAHSGQPGDAAAGGDPAGTGPQGIRSGNGLPSWRPGW